MKLNPGPPQEQPTATALKLLNYLSSPNFTVFIQKNKIVKLKIERPKVILFIFFYFCVFFLFTLFSMLSVLLPKELLNLEGCIQIKI